MPLKKGTYVRHPKERIHGEWGIGIVLEDEKNDKVPIFFEHNSQRKVIGTDYVQLKTIDDPGNSAILLQNALYEDIGDRQPFPLVLEKFLLNFPGGLCGELYLTSERNYKVEASELAQELLAKDRLVNLINQEDWGLLVQILKGYILKLTYWLHLR